MLPKFVVAWYKIVKLFEILERPFNTLSPPESVSMLPGSHEEHGLSIEFFDIFISKLLVMIVLQDFESV